MIVAGALSIPLALAVSGVASADTDTSRDATYYESTSTAGPHGASSHVVYSNVDDGWDWGHGGYGWHHHGVLSGLLYGLL
ncbi:hypothetical protein ACFFQW_18925 [Umezawaea endophytica]|uniref:Uncharacterized protein n=1 Tax=Umezawaea endophytica TaxID=1654476 RepID=A0A9X2VNF7_9PSEU|nr:hypothetical protein [Umezawaea endophytica]MCS7479860.1 hypothetical protein [Umezawaea endophytica]